MRHLLLLALTRQGKHLAEGDSSRRAAGPTAAAISASLAVIVWAVLVSVPAKSDLDADRDQLFRQGASGVLGSTDAGDLFGRAVVAGDFDGDGHQDLAIGVPYEDVGNPAKENAGAVNVLYGDVDGLTSVGNQLWHQDTWGVFGAAEAGDYFGNALAAGDFNGDGYDDLAVGVPGEDYATADGDGGVHVLYGGSGGGLTATGDQFWSQDSPGMNDGTANDTPAEAEDSFGSVVGAGDFDGNGVSDLAFGVPWEDWATESNSGIVQVIYDSAVIFVNGFEDDDTSMWSSTVP